MEKIYHKYTSSNSYSSRYWYEEDWYLCSEEEYEEQKSKYEKKRKDIEKEYEMYEEQGIYSDMRDVPYDAYVAKERYKRLRYSPERQLKAQEYYYVHEWQGKSFEAVGFSWREDLECSTHEKYFIKPGTLGKISNCQNSGNGWIYGS